MGRGIGSKLRFFTYLVVSWTSLDTFSSPAVWWLISFNVLWKSASCSIWCCSRVWLTATHWPYFSLSLLYRTEALLYDSTIDTFSFLRPCRAEMFIEFSSLRDWFSCSMICLCDERPLVWDWRSRSVVSKSVGSLYERR